MNKDDKGRLLRELFCKLHYLDNSMNVYCKGLEAEIKTDSEDMISTLKIFQEYVKNMITLVDTQLL